MTYNIRHGRGLDGKVNIQRIADVIIKEDIDIVGLNEVDQVFSRRSNYLDQGRWLANELQMNFAFGPALSLRSGQYGNAIFSRFPLTKHKNHLFKLIPPIAEPRAILEAAISIENISIIVITSHFSIQPFLHRRQLDFCLNYPNSPCILMGDLNRGPRSSTYRKLSEKYIDCSAHRPFPTFPARKPRSRLDYIFTSKHFEIIKTDVIQSTASDHLPVMTTVKVQL
ncbi:MAG: endonuclease/exonuclease/phosphatase family protein [Anaerobacillus sp.]|uniref:endonuclease/exonuclease/phosphatase family protein n=1 Tax=Anaerobacillus sp. TaxID=1872506 RepID=UPI00391A3078